MNRATTDRSFAALMAAQVTGAFNDNAFKIIVSLWVLRFMPSPREASALISLIGLIFIVPFVVFSPAAGWLADHRPKHRILRVLSGVKVGNLLLAAAALAAQDLTLILAVLFLMMAESAFFSPAKYGLLPEMIESERLTRANAWLQIGTYAAIILGTAAGGVLFHCFDRSLPLAVVPLIVCALVGWAAAGFIRPAAHVATPAPERKARPPIGHAFRLAVEALKQDRPLAWALLGLSVFAFLGAAFQMNILVFGRYTLHASEAAIGFLLAAVMIGVGAGGWIAGALSPDRRIELGLVPVGALGMGVLCLILGGGVNGVSAAVAVLVLLGACGGMFTVPLQAFYQRRSPASVRGQTLALLNMISSAFVLLASGFLWAASGPLALSPGRIFVWLGWIACVTGVIVVKVIPETVVRFMDWVLTHTVYRMTVVNEDLVPETGGALLVCNHVSFVDAVLIMGALKRPVRFVMTQRIYEKPFIRRVCRAAGVIPLCNEGGPKAKLAALQQARAAVERGELVCVFPEGKLTRTGNLLPFQKGFTRIVSGLDVPVVPMYLDRVWGSVFSFKGGRYFWKRPSRIPYPVTLVVGRPLPSDTDVFTVRRAVQELSVTAFARRRAHQKPLPEMFLSLAKKRFDRPCTADAGRAWRYGELLTAALILSRRLGGADPTPDRRGCVGVWLPPSAAAAAANIGVSMSGRIPVNLNYSLSPAVSAACCAEAGVRTVITSRSFLRRTGGWEGARFVFIDEVLDETPRTTRLFLGCCTRFLPVFLLRRWFFPALRSLSVEDTATILFTSGSSGRPKGVMLSHANLLADIEGLAQVFALHRDDVMLSALPFFHAFGFTAGLCFPLGLGVKAVYHTAPLEARRLADLAQTHGATILLATPTMLSAYLKKVPPAAFHTLRLAVTGGEKLPAALAEAFEARFGAGVYEGYGATELSPIAAVNIPDHGDPHSREIQAGRRRGTVGHPLPGVAVKTVDPDTFEPKPCGEEGLLLVKGGNVMQGYLNRPDLTAQVIKDGWYVTGDLARIHEDGFLEITGRLSRFSKIGGEMVPHERVEEAIQEALGATDPVVAVVGVKDERKGERLLVLHSTDLDPRSVRERLLRQGWPALWVPKSEDFHRIDRIPVLGSGKRDLKALQRLAQGCGTRVPPVL